VRRRGEGHEEDDGEREASSVHGRLQDRVDPKEKGQAIAHRGPAPVRQG
jgi:hypothetical protein